MSTNGWQLYWKKYQMNRQQLKKYMFLLHQQNWNLIQCVCCRRRTRRTPTIQRRWAGVRAASRCRRRHTAKPMRRWCAATRACRPTYPNIISKWLIYILLLLFVITVLFASDDDWFGTFVRLYCLDWLCIRDSSWPVGSYRYQANSRLTWFVFRRK